MHANRLRLESPESIETVFSCRAALPGGRLVLVAKHWSVRFRCVDGSSGAANSLALEVFDPKIASAGEAISKSGEYDSTSSPTQRSFRSGTRLLRCPRPVTSQRAWQVS